MTTAAPFDIADWSRALNLSERAAGLRAAGRSDESDRARQPGSARAERRLERWRSQAPFSEDGFFDRRLAQDGLTPGDLRTLLEEEALIASCPDWLHDIEQAFISPLLDVPFPLSPDILDGNRQTGFLEAVRPLLDPAYARLDAGLRKLAAASAAPPFDPVFDPVFDPNTAGPLLARNLAPHLLFLVSRTFVLELFLAGENGRLAGETPEERFQSFVDTLRDPAVAFGLLRQYPVLARQLAETVTRWVDFSLEIVTHLTADAERLRTVFAPGRGLGLLTEVRADLGDPHRGGRSVALLRFDSGLGLIYKPRSMAVEAAFQDLLEWTGTRGFQPAFRRLRVLDGGKHGGEHGWAELVTAAPCSSVAELERFYLRQGGYLALLFALSATDMHHENLIAAGEHPVLVDLEALFHPQDKALGRVREGFSFPDTPLRVGFLPALEWARGAGEHGVDLSGLTAADGQVFPPVLQIEDAGTDRMRYLRRPVAMSVGEHRPTLDGAAVAATDYTEQIALGFDRMARLLASHRGELADPAGPLEAFAAAPVRVLIRPSMVYATLLMEGQHPYVLGDALERDRLLDRLWAAAPDFRDLERLIAAEQRDLRRGDIPIFTTLPGSRDLRTSEGEIIPGFLRETGLDRVRERLGSLGRLEEGEIERQTWIVRNSLDTLLSKEEVSQVELRERATGPAADELLAAATAVGRRLEALAFRNGSAAFWFVPNVQGRNERFVLTPAGPDVHLGVPGIALFLGYLGAVTGEGRFTDLARAAVVGLRDQIDQVGSISENTELLESIGAFSGWGGIVYTFTHLGVLWEDEGLLDEAERVAAALGPRIDADEVCDVVGGAAGCLVALLGLHTRRPSQMILDMAVRCGERILTRARPMASGIGWVYTLAGPTPLAGFSHGAAGISWALLQLADRMPDDAGDPGNHRFRRAALEALEYERSLFSAAEANWPDLRARDGEDPGEPHFMCAWCHGAAGIALGRLDSLRCLSGPAASLVREEAATAVATTLATGFGQGHCLCHGDMGNLEPLLLAAEVLEIPGLGDRIGRLAGGLLDSLREGGPRFGVGRAEVPGLMLGLAGVGYGLLRLAAPQRVPAVLRLAPPPLPQP